MSKKQPSNSGFAEDVIENDSPTSQVLVPPLKLDVLSSVLEVEEPDITTGTVDEDPPSSVDEFVEPHPQFKESCPPETFVKVPSPFVSPGMIGNRSALEDKVKRRYKFKRSRQAMSDTTSISGFRGVAHALIEASISTREENRANRVMQGNTNGVKRGLKLHLGSPRNLQVLAIISISYLCSPIMLNANADASCIENPERLWAHMPLSTSDTGG